jgi:two-component system chemotaxis response regulator CheB
MFSIVASVAGRKVIAAILTGMGADGAKGLLKLKQAGAYTIGQDEASCVVYGMPMEAYKLGACREQQPLDNIGVTICKMLSSGWK